jgi:hypothetical protein
VPLPSLAVETTDSLQPSLSLDEIVARMTVADSERHNGLNGYSVVRKYTLYNQRVSKTAEIVVRLEYGKHEGKRFEIVSSVEADGISGRVLHRLMETEAEASKKDAISDQSKVNPQNYNFDFLGMESKGGRDLYVLALRPKMKSKYLLRGTAWVDSKEFAITRIEGRPTASLSFWAGKPFIAMDFEKVDGFWLVAHNHSHAEGKLLGATDLTIDCSQYEVKGIGQTALGTITTNASPPIATASTDSHR